MNAIALTQSHSLARGNLLEIADAGFVDVKCLRGCLWITVDYDLRDIVLEPGGTFHADARRRVLVYALKPSEFSVQPARKHPTAATWPSRVPWRRAPGCGSMA